ncbi:UNVERIFIED_CONTAM: hypothetical protein HDU68_003143 [Siphonaria sp. JEL0065]|nr:hypothetical protein HDU68_003143 [Siphonaria sp. JEL0065]
MSFLAFALLISSALTALAFPVNTAAIEWGCQNSNQTTLAFRSLDYTILSALAAQTQTATFFVDPFFAVNQPFIVEQAVKAGHNFGLAITSPESLVNPIPCPNCDYPVNQSALDIYFSDKGATWNQAFGFLKANLNLVAFPNTYYVNQVPTNGKRNRFGSLQNAIVAKGFSPVIVPFGYDIAIAEGAAQHDFVLSNIVSSSAVFLDNNTPASTTAFVQSRFQPTVNVEDITVIESAVAFLATIGKTVVSASQCFGIAAN